MCDTLAIRRDGAVWFAKNSDREPEEPQRIERIPAVKGDPNPRLSCTYIEIDQQADRHGAILSRPDWMWGAEMGVNDAGVAIGNEAVFSKRMLKKGEALLGMDLVRLGLERAGSANEAAQVMIGLLLKYGQGGPAGYRDKKFRYDGSFLIADARDILVLETAGRDYALKSAGEVWSISNAYTLRADHDASSHGPGVDFKAAVESFAMPRLACAAERREASFKRATAAPSMSLGVLAAILRTHDRGDGFEGGSNRDLCMHAMGPLRPHATTASLIVKLAPGAPPRIAATGALHPCLSLFKPVSFALEAPLAMAEGLGPAGAAAAARARKEPDFRARLRAAIATAEPSILAAIEAGDEAGADAMARAWAADALEFTL